MSGKNLHLSLLLISSLFLVLFTISPVSGFCPANVLLGSSESGYACVYTDNNNPDSPNCKAYHNAQCCIARCYPDCGVVIPSGCQGTSCSCDSSVNSAEPQLTIVSRSDIGQNEVSILISAWEPGIPNQKPVPNVIIDIQVSDSSGNKPFSFISATHIGALTGDNGAVTVHWKWDPRDAGKSWNVNIKGYRPGYLDGSTFTRVLCPLPTDGLKVPTDGLKVSIDEKGCTDGQCHLESKVIAMGSEDPIPNAAVEYRVWRTQNGGYTDWGPYLTNANGIHKIKAKSGTWRIDVYAWKEGYINEDWSNIYDVCGGSFCNLQSNAGTSLKGIISGLGTASLDDSVKIGTPATNETVTQSPKPVPFPLPALFISLIIVLVLVVVKGHRD